MTKLVRVEDRLNVSMESSLKIRGQRHFMSTMKARVNCWLAAEVIPCRVLDGIQENGKNSVLNKEYTTS